MPTRRSLRTSWRATTASAGRRPSSSRARTRTASKIAQAAASEGLDPRSFVDRMAGVWRELPGLVNASNDFFIRTTDPGHATVVQEFVQQHLRRRRHLRGRLPRSLLRRLRGLLQRVGPRRRTLPAARNRARATSRRRTTSSGSRPIQQPSARALRRAPEFVLPRIRYNEARRFIEQGLDDISISRAGQSWGIPVPWDPEQVIYVWVDALINYVSALAYARRRGRPAAAPLAARSAHPRQGHPEVPLRHLAGAAPGGGLRGPAAARSCTATC